MSKEKDIETAYNKSYDVAGSEARFYLLDY